MDQSHEKMQQQNETIEKLENDIRELTESKYSLETELQLVKVNCFVN
jgi:FtsZ-binding cell division protein ZapB